MTQPYPEAPTPDCISCSEADDSYSLELLKQHAQATHDRGYSVGWDAGFAHGRAQARAELIAELKPVAYIHRLVAEGNQVVREVINRRKRHSFGIPGENYSAEYERPSIPLAKIPKE